MRFAHLKPGWWNEDENGTKRSYSEEVLVIHQVWGVENVNLTVILIGDERDNLASPQFVADAITASRKIMQIPEEQELAYTVLWLPEEEVATYHLYQQPKSGKRNEKPTFKRSHLPFIYRQDDRKQVVFIRIGEWEFTNAHEKTAVKENEPRKATAKFKPREITIARGKPVTKSQPKKQQDNFALFEKPVVLELS